MNRPALIACVVAALAARAAAQPATVESATATVSSRFVIDGAPGAGLGGAWGVRGDAVVFGDLTWVAGTLDGGDLRLRAGAEVDLWRPAAYGVRVRVAAFAARAETSGFTATGIGGELGLLAGRFGARWSAAVELRASATVATHLEHTAWYRTHVYPDVHDGWYRTTAESGRAGVRGGGRAGPVVASLSAGWSWFGAFDLLPSPSLELDLGYAW